jgi:hypothetical protein
MIMSKLTLTTQKTLLATAMIVGLASIAGTASAAPTQFTATATVQNAVTITEVNGLDFGTVFATTTGVGAIAARDATYAEKLVLSETGTAAVTNAAALALAPKLVTLGGTQVGQYSAPGIPSNGKVKVSFFDAGDTAFSPAATVAAADCNYDTPSAAKTAHKIVLENGADPTTGFFCVDVFTTNRALLLTTGYTVGFGVTTLTFDLGATLIGQSPLTAVTRTYQPGPYSGSFGMEVTFP